MKWVNEVVGSIKFAVGVICAGIGSALVSVLDVLPDDIEKLGVLLTMAFTIIASIYHIRKIQLQEKHAKLREREAEARIRLLNRGGERLATTEALLGTKE